MLSLLVSFVSAANDTVNIRDVKLRYCNGTGELTKMLELNTEANKTESLCLEFENEGAATATVGLNFVDGTLTADTDQKKACLPEGERELFWQYITWYDQQFTLPGRMKKRVIATATFPEWYVGMSYGCATYFLVDAQPQQVEQDGNMFNVFARVGSFIDIFVDGIINAKLVTAPVEGYGYTDMAHNSNFVIYRKNLWTLAMRTTLYNTGNVAVTGDVVLERSTWWGIFSSHSTYEWHKFLPRQSITLEKDIPWYIALVVWGPVQADLEVEYTPVVLGKNYTEVSSDILIDTNGLFLFPWIIVVLFLLLVIKYFQDKKRKVVVPKTSRTLSYDTKKKTEEVVSPKKTVSTPATKKVSTPRTKQNTSNKKTSS